MIAMSTMMTMTPVRERCATLGRQVLQALLDEVTLTPKPGLVDLRSRGAHTDLNWALMCHSACVLEPVFAAMADAGARSEDDDLLRQRIGAIGRDGEALMLAATGGVNTHRGAIWALGLLVTAAALEPDNCSAGQLTLRAAKLALIEDRNVVAQQSHGAQVAQRYGAMGAKEQAQLGFPAVMQKGLPQLQCSRANASGEQNARLDALLAIMTTLADTCVLYRSGLEGLNAMQQGAQRVLDAGGSASLAGRRRLHELDQQLLQLNASPGGAADLLAACLFIDSLEPALGSESRSV